MSVSGDLGGARDVIEAAPAKVAEVEMGEPPVADVDTWDEYERIKDRSL